MANKILIVGRTGTGKDYLAQKLTDLGLKQVISFATRPKRSPDEDSHIFITEEEAARLTDRVAKTRIDGYEYFSTKRQVDSCDVYIIDPKGLYELVDAMPETHFIIAHITADTSKSFEHAANRAEDREKEKGVVRSRSASEDEQFTEWEERVAAGDIPSNCTVVPVFNDYTEKAFDECVSKVMALREQKKKKRRVIIDGFFGIVDNRAHVQAGEKMFTTSDVLDYLVTGGYVFIETQNTIYTTK